MEVVNAERLDLHHGQLRVFVQHKGAGKVQPGVRDILEMERARSLDKIETFTAFAADVQRIKQELTKTINDLPYEVGPSLDVVPRVSADGRATDLSIIARIRLEGSPAK